MAKLVTDDQAYALDRMNKRSRDNNLGTALQTVGLKKKGTFTTAGGDAAETITDADVAATDFVIVVVKTAGSTPVSVVAAAAGSGSISVTMSADPSTDHVLNYFVFAA